MAFHSMDDATRSFYKDAIDSARHTFFELEWFEKDAIKLLPKRPDIPILLQEIQTVLREESGGVRPDKFLRDWLEDTLRGGAWRYTPEQNDAVRKVAERWSDQDKIKREFWFLESDEPYTPVWFTKKILVAPRGMELWLRRSRIPPDSGPIHPSLLPP